MIWLGLIILVLFVVIAVLYSKPLCTKDKYLKMKSKNLLLFLLYFGYDEVWTDGNDLIIKISTVKYRLRSRTFTCDILFADHDTFIAEKIPLSFKHKNAIKKLKIIFATKPYYDNIG